LPHADADLDSRREHRAGIGNGGARTLDVLIQEVLEFRALRLVCGGVHVREIVCDHFHIRLLRQHSGGGDAQGSHGSITP